MSKILTLAGARDGLAATVAEAPRGATDCSCSYNPRTKKYAQLCRVPGTKSKSGKQFVAGGDGRCRLVNR